MNLINKNLQSVKFFTNYTNWAKNLDFAENKLINNTAKVIALSLSVFVLLGSIFIFIFNDIPMLIKDACGSFQSNSNAQQLFKPLFIASSAYLLYQANVYIMSRIQDIKNKALVAITVSLIGVSVIAYSAGYFRIIG